MAYGGTVKLTGESEYKKALSEITSGLKVLSSEMQLVSAQYSKNDTSIDSYTKKNNVLKDQINKQKEVVSVYSQALEDAKRETGENSTTTNRWQTELNKAQTTLVKMENEVKANEEAMKDSASATDKNSDSLDDYTKATEDAGTGTLKLGDLIKANLISEAIIGGIKAIGNAMKEVGGAILDVGKQAVSSFADYEQLIGGVETLFKESAGEVQEYANNAYKSAGLSANEYMETVTSFSASLLQSLDGDTAKSAKVADMAITDMADNANKMGTSMGSIQSAYQGFAKQNYTMLDNLKLGYGGTKGEMERLLADATKLSGVKYDISSLKDVYEAIHVIQSELDITGTTAKEASVTISGSVNAMKSSWQNLLTGLADGNADLTGLIDNVVSSALTVADNILPVIEQVASSVLEVLPKLLENIITQLPKFIETGSKILTSIISGLQSNMLAIMTAVMQILQTLITTIVQNLPMILEMGIQMIVSLVQGIASSLPELIPTIIDAVLLMVETLLDNIDLLIDAGIELIIGLADGLILALPQLIDKIPIIIEKLIIAITTNLPKIIAMGVELTIKLAVGLIKAIPQLVSKIPQIIVALVKGLGEGLKSMATVGLDLVKGIWNGISNATSWILDKIKGFGKAILNGIKSFFGIKSPSTLFRDEIGLNLGLGVAEGIEDSLSSVQDAMSDLNGVVMSEVNPKMNLSSLSGNDLAISMGAGKQYVINFYPQSLSPSELDVAFDYITRKMGDSTW